MPKGKRKKSRGRTKKKKSGIVWSACFDDSKDIATAKQLTEKINESISYGKYAAAEHLLLRAIDAYPEDPVWYSLLIHVYSGLNNIYDAKKILDKAIKLGIVNAYIYNSMLKLYLRLKKFTAGLILFKKIRDEGIADKATYSLAISLYSEQNMVKKARQVFNDAILDGYGDSILYSIIINAYLKRGDILNAKILYAIAVLNKVDDDAMKKAISKRESSR